jgi:hypothetical protein
MAEDDIMLQGLSLRCSGRRSRVYGVDSDSYPEFTLSAPSLDKPTAA